MGKCIGTPADIWVSTITSIMREPRFT